MAKTKKTQGKLARYVNTPEAMEKFRRHYGVPDEELPESQPAADDVAGPSNTWISYFFSFHF